jgi:hypothetical protein
VALLEDVGPDLETIPDLPLDRVTAAIELRVDVLDDDGLRRLAHPASFPSEPPTIS